MTGDVPKRTPDETWTRFGEVAVVADRLVGETPETQWEATERLTGFHAQTMFDIAEMIGRQHDTHPERGSSSMFLTGLLFGWLLARVADGDSLPDGVEGTDEG